MPGSIRVVVLSAADITADEEDGVSVKASMGKKQFKTEAAPTTSGKAGPWDVEHNFSVLSLTDPVSISLVGAKGEVLGSAQVTTPSIVEKGFRDEWLEMQDEKGTTQGRVHVKLSFVLSDEERKKIEAMRAKSLARKGDSPEKTAPSGVPLTGPARSPSMNGRKSRFSFEKANGNGESLGEVEVAPVLLALDAEVNAEVAAANTAASEAMADVAKQAREAAASSTEPVASSAEKLADKATELSQKAAGVAANAAGKAGGQGPVGSRKAEAKGGEEKLRRQPSVKDRVAALEVPAGPQGKGGASQEEKPKKQGDARLVAYARAGSSNGRMGGVEAEEEEARLAAEDWARAQAVELALRREEERKREEDAKRVGREAAQAERYEREYREQRQREEERRRKEEEKKKEQERQREAKAAAAASQAAAEEQRRAERAEKGEDEAEKEGGNRNMWQQIAGTAAFAIALFMLWPRESGKGVTSRRRAKVSGGTYRVKKGDTLDNIVGRMCYNPESDFYKLNPDVCDRNTIYPGQILQVPDYQ